MQYYQENDFEFYKYKELNDKTLKIKVVEEDGCTLVSGVDINSGITYILLNTPSL